MRVPRHDGHDSGLMADSIPMGCRTISLSQRNAVRHGFARNGASGSRSNRRKPLFSEILRSFFTKRSEAVADCLRRAKVANLSSWSLVAELDEAELSRRLYPAAGVTPSRPAARPLPDRCGGRRQKIHVVHE